MKEFLKVLYSYRQGAATLRKRSFREWCGVVRVKRTKIHGKSMSDILNKMSVITRGVEVKFRKFLGFTKVD